MGRDRGHFVRAASAGPVMSERSLRLTQEILRLVSIMRRLRDPQTGCAWDRKQTPQTLAKYSLEEAHEVVDAIERNDWRALRDELGDLLFQIVFLAQCATETRQFDLADVAQGIADKLERRHPHLFQDGVSVAPDWEALKAEERAARGAQGPFADIPATLPALMRAQKVAKRAAAVGFDWPSADGPRDKILEELAEVDGAVAASDLAAKREELGDLLLAVVNWARHLGVDAEEALRLANQKFESRFVETVKRVQLEGAKPAALSLQDWDRHWEAAKQEGAK